MRTKIVKVNYHSTNIEKGSDIFQLVFLFQNKNVFVKYLSCKFKNKTDKTVDLTNTHSIEIRKWLQLGFYPALLNAEPDT